MQRNAQPFAINTYSYTMRFSARDCLVHLAAQGFTEFELMMYPGHLWPADTDAAQRRELKRFVVGRGLKVVTLNMPNIDMNVAGAAAEMRDYTLAILKQIVELAGDLGAPGVVIGPGKHNPLFPAPRERLTGYFFKALDVLSPLADKVGTALCVENMPFAFLPDAESLMTTLDRYGNDRIGVVYDVANAEFIKEDLATGFRRVAKRLRLVHLSDTGHQVYRHDPVGRGAVDFAAIPAMIREVDHRMTPMLEIISSDADRDIPDSVERLLGLGWRARAAG